MKNWTYLFCFFPLLLLFMGPGRSGREYVQCQRVMDGDTAVVQWRGQLERLRFKLIDAPELAQLEYRGQRPLGQIAKKELEQFCGQTWELKEVERDRYGRLLAQVYQDGQDLGVLMVARGAAVIYERAIFTSRGQKVEYWQAMMTAKKFKRGFWGTHGMLSPYKYRYNARQKASKRVNFPKKHRD